MARTLVESLKGQIVGLTSKIERLEQNIVELTSARDRAIRERERAEDALRELARTLAPWNEVPE